MELELDRMKEIFNRARQEIGKVVIGQDQAVTCAMIAIFTNNHALIEGVPGIAKTLMVRTLAHVLGCDFGRIQFLRGAHYQDMECWPPYWAGLPPMRYATHAVSPLLALAGTRATKVHCFGSGTMREELRKQYGNPFPVETAIYELAIPGLCAEVTRSLFHCARPYMESFTIYGENACYEWQMEGEAPMLFRASPVTPGCTRTQSEERPEAPDQPDLLPPSIGRFTKRFVYGQDDRHLSFEQGGGHHGSHPHLVHEFVRSIVEERKPWIDAVTAANWTAAGICAHESAMAGGREVVIPDFA